MDRQAWLVSVAHQNLLDPAGLYSNKKEVESPLLFSIGMAGKPPISWRFWPSHPF
jgi:hypothetical protein